MRATVAVTKPGDGVPAHHEHNRRRRVQHEYVAG
jgi:hypothetical protein